MMGNFTGSWKWLLAFLALGLMLTGCGTSDETATVEPADFDYAVRPVVFVHGGAGSASQFESQAQRFMANGYPLEYIGVYEYNTRLNPDDQVAVNDAGINAVIDHLLQVNNADKVDLIGHSMGTRVSQLFLSTPANAAKVAHYVNVDGYEADALPGGVLTLALWGQASADKEIADAQNDHNAEQSHIQTCTSAESFVKMYRFFTGEEPLASDIPESTEDLVYIAGRANIFPENWGAAGRTLKIYEVDPDTGYRVSDTPIATNAIGSDGEWGPELVKKGVAYEFALVHDTESNADHHFYREPFMADDYFIRLNTSEPGSGVGSYLPRCAGHTNLMIGRDKEMWGDQGADNDILEVDGINVLTPIAAAQSNRLSALFLFSAGPDEVPPLNSPETDCSDTANQLDTPNTFFHGLPFISGLDLHIPAASPPDRTISIVMTPRGGNGAVQTINVPNWPSDQIRSISVQFRDFVQ